MISVSKYLLAEVSGGQAHLLASIVPVLVLVTPAAWPHGMAAVRCRPGTASGTRLRLYRSPLWRMVAEPEEVLAHPSPLGP